MLKTTILRSHHWQQQKTNQSRIQRVTARSTPLHPRSMPPSTTKLAIRLNIRQLHRNTRRSKRHHVGRPTSTTRSHTHHQRLTLLQLRQTHRQLRNHQSHRQTRRHLPRPTTSSKLPERKQNRNDSAERHTTPQNFQPNAHPCPLPNKRSIAYPPTLPNPQTKKEQPMSQFPNLNDDLPKRITRLSLAIITAMITTIIILNLLNK